MVSLCHKDFVVDLELNGEPVELLQNRSDVMDSRGSGDDGGSRILDQFKFMEGGQREGSCNTPGER